MSHEITSKEREGGGKKMTETAKEDKHLRLCTGETCSLS